MSYDVIVIGAGVVGLATAYQIQQRKPGVSILMLEKEDRVAKHQTGNNSGVIHSGIYYAPGSYKARNCREGYELLVDFARTESIPYEICGKLIVATDESEVSRLQDLFERGKKNGLDGLTYLGPDEIRGIEPHCTGVRAIRVPQTGIINYRMVCERLKARIEAAGGRILFKQEVRAIERTTGGVTVKTQDNSYEARRLVSCAGLHSDRVAMMTVRDLPLRIVPFRGEYYEIKESRRHLVKHLIYPVPDPAFPFLGVHFTRGIDGSREAGPNAVLAFAREGYKKSDIDLGDLLGTLAWPGFQRVALKYWRMGLGEFYRSYSKGAFVRALQRLIPEITPDDLEPGGAGIRAQASARDGGLVDDFYFVEQDGIVHVCNAPSPAATASLAIGKAIAEKITL